MKHNLHILLISLILTGCSSLKDNLILGASTGAATGFVTGKIGRYDTRSTLILSGWGALSGAAVGAAIFGLMKLGKKDSKDRLEMNDGSTSMKSTDSNFPSLSRPEVERVWMPDRIEGNRLVRGHFIYVIRKPSQWMHFQEKEREEEKP